MLLQRYVEEEKLDPSQPFADQGLGVLEATLAKLLEGLRWAVQRWPPFRLVGAAASQHRKSLFVDNEGKFLHTRRPMCLVLFDAYNHLDSEENS